MPGRDDYFRAGSNGDPREKPVDLAAVQADDALLDLIGRAGYTPSEADDELTCLLAAWRREVHAEPFGELVDTDTALTVIHAAAASARRRPVFGTMAAAAAVLVIAFSAVGLLAKSAHPGDRLWGVTQVLYSDYAHSVETAVAVRTELSEAKAALQEGKPEQARAKLQQVQQQLPAIGEAEDRTDLTARHRQLEQMLNGSPQTGSSVNLPGVPVLPPPIAPSAGSAPSRSPKPSPSSSSTDSSATSNSPPEQPSRPEATRPPRMPPGRGYPGPDDSSRSETGPVGSPGTMGSPGTAGSPGPSVSGITRGGTTGKDAPDGPGGGSGQGTAGGAHLSGGGQPNSGSPTSNPESSSPPTSSHASSTPPSDGFPPVCDRPGPRPPVCG